MTTVKVKFGNDIRRFTVEDNIEFGQFVNILSKLFPDVNIQNYLISYLDEENDVIFIATNEELKEAVRITKTRSPPILRVSVIAKDKKDEKINPAFFDSKPSTSTVEYSNWPKKQLEEESKKKENVEHVVKICGKPFQVEEKKKKSIKVKMKLDDHDDHDDLEVCSPSVEEKIIITPPKEDIPRKKTIKERVETLSEEQKNKTLKYSEDITEQTLKYSNQILEGTMPLTRTIYENSINSSEMISNKLSNTEPSYGYVNVNYDELVNNVSSKLDEYSSNISRDVDKLSLGVNRTNQLIHKDIFTKSDEKSQETLQIVDEKSTKLLNELDQWSKVNTDVNIKYQDVITTTVEIESKLNTLSTTTNDNTINISDNIAKNILSI